MTASRAAWRPRVSTALAVLTAVLAVGALAAGYVRHVAVDDEQFANRAAGTSCSGSSTRSTACDLHRARSPKTP